MYDIFTREMWTESKALGYRWWTVTWWHNPHEVLYAYGVKLGPLSVQRWKNDGRVEWSVCVLNRVVWDTWIGRH